VVDGAERPISDTYYWIGLASLSYLPATVVPAGLSVEGLPIGVQIIGPEFADRRCLVLARLLEQAHRGFVPPPGY
jgi:amidase